MSKVDRTRASRPVINSMMLSFILLFSSLLQADVEADFQQSRQWLLTAPAQVIPLLEPYVLAPQSKPEISDLQRLELLALLARAYIVQSDIASADKTVDALSELARHAMKPLYQGIALRERGAILFIQTQYGQALGFYERALPFFQAAKNQSQVGQTYNVMAQALRAQQRYVEALSYARMSLALLREAGATAAMAEVLNAMGVILERLNNLEESLVAHSQALDIRRALNDRPGLADSLYNIGEIYRELQDYVSAEVYLSESVAVDKELNNLNNYAYGLHKLADIQCAQNKLDESRENDLQALALFTQLKATENQVAVYTNLVRMEIKAGNYQEAQGYLTSANSLLTNSMSEEIKYRLAIYAAKILAHQGDFTRAEVKLRNNIASFKLDVDPGLQLSVYRTLSDMLAQQGKVQEALEVLKQHNVAHDRLMRDERSKSIANLQASVDFMRREQQLVLLSKDKNLADVQSQKKTFENNVIVFGFLVFFALFFALISRYQTRRANLVLTQQVTERTAELETKNKELQRAYGQLQAVSQTDQLTGLSNRRFLLEHIEHDCAKSIRDYLSWLQGKVPVPTQSDMVFYLIDLDFFKHVNDRFGHSAGDAVLANMKSLLSSLFRETDYMVRWGGEEFLVVARFSQRENAALLAERLRDLIEQSVFHINAEQEVKLTASVGFACFPFFSDRPAQYDWQQVVDIADTCLYAAKHSGRNCWVGLTGVEGLEQTDTFDRLFTEPEQVIGEGWVNLYTSVDDPQSLGWQKRVINSV